MRLRYTLTANRDLADVWRYLANERGEQWATRFVLDIDAVAKLLVASPQMGARRSAIAKDVRVVFHAPYAIYYHVAENDVVILRVIHGSRDLDSILDAGGFSATV